MIHVLHGDCLDLLRGMPDNTVDAIVTDPPAGISFMGSAWDSNKGGREQWSAWLADVMAEAFRVVKPGGHALVWALPRTAHWTACGLEDAGWDLRDCITHIFATGFPKSLDVSKAIDKAAGATREVVGRYVSPQFAEKGYEYSAEGARGRHKDPETRDVPIGNSDWEGRIITAPATDAARQWQGWGTALKPAAEFWWLARKPLAGTVASNVAAWGTGAINIDATRVNPGEHVPGGGGLKGGATLRHEGWQRPSHLDGAATEAHDRGRWPSNLILSHAPTCGRHLRTLGDTHCRACNLQLPTDAPCEARCVDGCPVRELDQQAGPVGSNSGKPNRADGSKSAVGIYSPGSTGGTQTWETRQPGASRFFPVFRYQPKAPARERPKVNGVAHSTVKPLTLMRWLVRLVTPPGGVILDMFAGSGTTGEAAALEGFDCILIEREDTYLPLIAARLERAGADHDCPDIADTPQDDEEQTA